MLFHHRAKGRKASQAVKLLLPYVVSACTRRQLQSIVDYDSHVPNRYQSEVSRKVWSSHTPEQRRAKGIAVSLGRKRRKKLDQTGSKADKEGAN